MSVETGGTGISAVKIELLKLGNYVSWSSSMIAQLKSKGWWRIVHGDRVLKQVMSAMEKEQPMN